MNANGSSSSQSSADNSGMYNYELPALTKKLLASYGMTRKEFDKEKTIEMDCPRIIFSKFSEDGDHLCFGVLSKKSTNLFLWGGTNDQRGRWRLSSSASASATGCTTRRRGRRVRWRVGRTNFTRTIPQFHLLSVLSFVFHFVMTNRGSI